MFEHVSGNLNFPVEEARILKFWEANGIYEKSLERRRGGPPFVFYEGPPTANGLPHPGHCLTRAMKDLFPRYKTMTGHYCLRKGGWDTHGLPVEVEVCKELGIHSKEEIEAYGVEPFNRKCLESVFRYTREWETMTKRLGFWVNLEEAYVTYHKSYVESVWWSLKQLFDAGLLYQGHKIVWWWAQGGTALSAGEVGQGYREVDDPSVYVRFPIVCAADDVIEMTIPKDASPDSLDQVELVMKMEDLLTSGIPKDEEADPDVESALARLLKQSPIAYLKVLAKSGKASLLVWTTTPWTLPSNMYAAVHKDFDYAIVHDTETGERLIFADALVAEIAKKTKKTDAWKVEAKVKGAELVGLRYRPPFDCYYGADAAKYIADAPRGKLADHVADLSDGDPEHVFWRVSAADFVTLDSGTGLVHEAPAFGEVDYDLFMQNVARLRRATDAPLLFCVAPNGKFTEEGPDYCRGRWVKECDKDICRDMKERGLLLHQEQYRHDYPFCWRADEDPLIQYPRESWFIRTTQFKDAMLANNQHIHWLPDHIKGGRFGKFLESNVDWSLSRERYWGTPLPIWVCDCCGRKEAIDSYDALCAKAGVEGLDVWENAKRADPAISDHLKVHKPYIDAISYSCDACAGADSSAARAEARGSLARMRRVPEVIDCWYDSGAMPFAQWGWPHKNRDMFAAQFPANFISEALDQTRGWFYSLTAISVMLFGERGVARDMLPALLRDDQSHPFETCIVLGLLLGEDGLKMSKSKKNYREPSYIFDHEGADAMRWLFFSGQTPWTSIRFQESAIAEGQREFLIRLYNCYSFFVIYANIDKWTPANSAQKESANDLDRWILSALGSCSVKVFDAMEAYDNFNAARTLNEFVDALSNWYVRRCRDRFWRSEMDADKRAAYATLHECLVTVTKLIAPFTPFLAESMYQNLVRTHDSAAPESVHLCDYPVTAATRAAVVARIDEACNREIDIVRQVVSCGRAARSAMKLRVRQPLATIELFHREADVIAKHDATIKDELNVKAIDFVAADKIDQYVHYEVKPDFKRIGPKYGPLAPKIKQALTKHPNPDEIVRQLEKDGAYHMTVDGQDVELTGEEVKVELHARDGYAAERIPGNGIIVLDTHITPALRDEGWARDLVNQIQQLRKKMDLRYEQRIDLAIASSDENIRRVVNAHATHIQGETLANTLLSQPIAGAESESSTIDEMQVAIYVKGV